MVAVCSVVGCCASWPQCFNATFTMESKTAGGSLPIFRDLTADDPEPEITEIESLCMNCSENVCEFKVALIFVILDL